MIRARPGLHGCLIVHTVIYCACGCASFSPRSLDEVLENSWMMDPENADTYPRDRFEAGIGSLQMLLVGVRNPYTHYDEP